MVKLRWWDRTFNFCRIWGVKGVIPSHIVFAVTGTVKRGPIPLKEGELMYWDITIPLSYQRNFNFINGERSIGKTYTTLKYFIKRFIAYKEEYIYITRTQMEKQSKILQSAFAKVTANEYSEYDFMYTNETMKMEGEVVGYCLALTEADKIKKRSFPNVKWMVFDEYMIDEKAGGHYINGWNEPDSLLSIYHTADREQDRIRCFLLGNNITFFNPYHLHPAFNIPQVSKGSIWTSENVLFQWAESDAEMQENKANSKFLRMIQDTEYGGYAVNGEYVQDDYSLIQKRPSNSRYTMTIKNNGSLLGVWSEKNTGRIFISKAVDPCCSIKVGLTMRDINGDYILYNISYPFKWLSDLFRRGLVSFESMELKTKNAELVKRLIRR